MTSTSQRRINYLHAHAVKQGMKVSTSALLVSAGLAGITAVAVKYKLPVLATPEAAIVLNTVSMGLFVMYCEEAPDYNGEQGTKPHPVLKTFTNKQVGALVLGVLVLNYMYSNWQCVRDARLGEGHVAAPPQMFASVHPAAAALPQAATSLP